jgi:sugar phosphate permease
VARAQQTETLEQATIDRVYWRLIPLLFGMMFFNYLNRINVGYAALQMNQDLGFSPAVFGFGAGVFFIGYMLLEVPSNLMLHRFGARLWLSRILVSWGAVASATAFVSSPMSFYVLRFLLGVAEAGLMPGLALYVTYWFPKRYRARAFAGYIIAGSFSAILGAPLSTVLMTAADEVLGVDGWRWMFFAEGIPTMLLGCIALVYLTDRPEHASWLTPAQREWLVRELRVEEEAEGPEDHRLAASFGDPRVWTLGSLFACALVGTYGLLMWLPQMLKGMGELSDIQVGLFSALPPLLGVAGTLLISRNSDRTGERKIHLAVVYGAAGAALLGSSVLASPAVAYALLCVAAVGLSAGSVLAWSLNASLMTGPGRAVSIALVGSIAQIGGLVGPWLIGVVKDTTGSFSLALAVVSGFVSVAAVIAATMRVGPSRSSAETQFATGPAAA